MKRSTKNRGQSLAEYGLILALIAVACISALTTLGSNVATMMGNITGAIGGATAATCYSGSGGCGGGGQGGF